MTRRTRTAEHRAFLKEAAEDYDVMLAAQNGGCALCGNPPKTRRLHIDHDHKLMRVRGLLCHRCNRALPSWITPEWLRAAASYLDRKANQAAAGSRSG